MAWYLKLMKDGELLTGARHFDAVNTAICAANSALREGEADDVTVGSEERETIFYQFSTIRTSSEEGRIRRMLEEASTETASSAAK